MPRIESIRNNSGTRSVGEAPIELTPSDNTGKCFAYVAGRTFDYWVDLIEGGARDNGYNLDGPIFILPYIIESLLRDEKLAERNLITSTVTDTTHIIINGLASSEDDYYNYATYYNATQLHKTYVTDYAGATKTLVLNDADTNATAGDSIFLLNVRGDYKIDYAGFDVLGNTSDGTRPHLFSVSISQKTPIDDIISTLAFESHCEFIKSCDPNTGEILYKLVAIDSGSGDTWTNPAYIEGVEQIVARLTPLETVVSDFKLHYAYDAGQGAFTKELSVNKNGYTTTASSIGITEQNLCKYVESTYKINNFFEYSSYYIQADATAEYFLQKKIQWFTKQRLLVRVITPITGNFDWIKYERGDQVKLNFSKGIPTGLNNSSMFMITNKTITPTISGGLITWELIEL